MAVVRPDEMRKNLIMARLREHYNEALEHFPKERIVGIFIQGSQNYELDYEYSDIDTKLIVVPSFEDIVLNRKPVSTTHIRANEEHIDFKDIRLYMETFRKQNLNFLEILFTPFKIINPMYEAEWERLIEAREFIAHMNEYRAVKSMKGIAMEKFHAMEHEYPSKVDVLAKYGYDPKQLHHLIRVENYLDRYMNGVAYEDCLIPEPEMKEYLMSIKRGNYNLEEARVMAKESIDKVVAAADKFCEPRQDEELRWVRNVLEDVQANIMKISIKEELAE